jgi:hypothetical protein
MPGVNDAARKPGQSVRTFCVPSSQLRVSLSSSPAHTGRFPGPAPAVASRLTHESDQAPNAPKACHPDGLRMAGPSSNRLPRFQKFCGRKRAGWGQTTKSTPCAAVTVRVSAGAPGPTLGSDRAVPWPRWVNGMPWSGGAPAQSSRSGQSTRGIRIQRRTGQPRAAAIGSETTQQKRKVANARLRRDPACGGGGHGQRG